MARSQFTFTFTNAQPGSVVSFDDHVAEHLYAAATGSTKLGRPLVLNSSNSLSVWTDVAVLTATTEDGAGNEISATATVAAPSVTTAEGTPGQNPYSAASGVSAATTPVSSAVINLPGIGLDVETVFFSADVGGTPVLAWGLEGDAFPRVVIAGDPNWGIWFGGGNTDPTLGFSAINGDGIGVGLWGQTGARVDCRANAVHVHGDDFEVTTPSVFFTALPTVDPGVSGGLWVDAGVLKISP